VALDSESGDHPLNNGIRGKRQRYPQGNDRLFRPDFFVGLDLGAEVQPSGCFVLRPERRSVETSNVHLLIVAQVGGHFPIAMGDAGQLQWVGTIADVTHMKIMKMVTGMGAISSFGPAPGIGPFARIQRCSGSMARAGRGNVPGAAYVI
jgi:hypothetical protein